MKIRDNGVTLIALVVTVVVLLILAGITIGSISGKDSVIEQTEETAKNAQRESIIEKIEADLYNEKVKTGKLPTKAKLKEIINNNYGTVDKDGENEKDSFTSKDGGYQISFNEIEGWKIDISEYVKVGDYIEYEPTKIDANKTLEVDSNKLTYTSPVGGYSETEGKILHGNGNGDQKFTAKPNSELKWKVLNISEDKVELISDSVVKTDVGNNFIIEGGIGYLYAEQELNEICKIYGYGYGADTDLGVTYTVGGPQDTPIKGKIKGTGARSITIEDLNKIANITEEDFITLNASYGNETNPTTEVYYPTLNSRNNSGQSTSKKTGFKYTYYGWNKTKIEDTNIQNILFNGRYWLASRCISTSSSHVYLSARRVYGDDISVNSLCFGNVSELTQYKRNECGVRPVVTIKANVIDVFYPLVDTNNVTTWKLK